MSFVNEKKEIFFEIFTFYLHISKIIINFAAEFTPVPFYTVDGCGFFTYWMAFIDALYLTHKKLRTLLVIPSQNQSNNYAYGYDYYTRPVFSLQACCHIGVGFIVVYLTRWASSKALVRRWAIAKSALFRVCICIANN